MLSGSAGESCGLLGVAADTTPLAAVDALRERVRALCPDCADEVHPFLARMMSFIASMREREGKK